VYQPYQLAIALRYLRSRSRDSFISFISLVSMLGIGLAVAVLIVVISVMNGFEHELQQRILGMVSDATIIGYEGPLDDWQAVSKHAVARPDVIAAAPFIEGEGMAVFGESFAGVGVRGIVPALERNVNTLATEVVEGDYDSLEPDGFNMLVGRALADQLGIGLGDKLVLLLAEARVTPAGIVPRARSFRVTGIFDAGMYEYDRGLVFISMAAASRLFQTGGKATSVSLRVDDIYAARDIATSVARELGGGFYVTDWSRQFANVFRSIALTKSIMFILLSMVVAVAAFNIVSTLIMVVREKRGDIAILRSFGAAPRSIMSVFATQGTAIGVAGTAFGLGLALLIMRYLDAVVKLIERSFDIDLLSAEVYFIADLPTQARFSDIAGICGIAFALAVAATFYPALRAARQPPAQALRYE
jgi:lipoprotein-releasing system permease protein